MFEILAVLCLAAALILLGVLAVIDLKTWLLPNEYVLSVAITGAVFHLCTAYIYADLPDMALGAVTGAGLLYALRAAAKFFYKTEAMGLGDVKLMGAAGLWLGPYNVLMAITVGAMAGVLHGVLLAIIKKAPLKNMQIPAGPGFALGIGIVGIIQFSDIGNILWPQ